MRIFIVFCFAALSATVCVQAAGRLVAPRGQAVERSAVPRGQSFLDALSISVDSFSLSMEERVVIKTPSAETFPDKPVNVFGRRPAQSSGGAAAAGIAANKDKSNEKMPPPGLITRPAVAGGNSEVRPKPQDTITAKSADALSLTAKPADALSLSAELFPPPTPPRLLGEVAVTQPVDSLGGPVLGGAVPAPVVAPLPAPPASP